MCVHAHACTCVRICMFAQEHTFAPECAHVFAHTNVHMCTYTHVMVYI